MTTQPTVSVPTQMGKRVKNVAISHTLLSWRLAANEAATKFTIGNIQRVKNAATRMKSENLIGLSCLVVGIGGPECFMHLIPDHNAGGELLHSRMEPTNPGCSALNGDQTTRPFNPE